jgi:uncharacterized protein YbjT (DUF2867 family)
MSRILITGGNGQLGRSLVAKLAPHAEYEVRVMSRRPRPDSVSTDIEWAQADLETGTGVRQAVAGVQTIVHAATTLYHTWQTDVDGTRRLLDEARAAGVSHVVYISIVGIDRISGYPYYAAKVAAEQLITESGIPWTILRATQFHYLLDLGLQWLSRSPIVPLPTDLPFQPVAQEEVALALAQTVAAGASGRLPDMGGPEVLTVKELARTWLQVRGMRRLILPVHLPGAAAAGFRRGAHTCPQNRQGRVKWREWVERTYAKSTDARRGSTPSLSRGH